MLDIFLKSHNTFEYQLPNEKIIRVVRRHWFYLLAPMALIAVSAILPMAAGLLLSFWDGLGEIAGVFWFVAGLYYLFLWNALFFNIMIYLLNTVIITDKRVIENIQSGLYKHAVNELPLDKIQDVTVRVHGMLASFLDFGNIEIQSAGAKTKFTFTCLPNPKDIKHLLH